MRFLSIVAVWLMVLALPGRAVADGPSADAQAQYDAASTVTATRSTTEESGARNMASWHSLSATQQAEVLAAGGCRSIGSKLTGKNALGNTLWTFKQTSDWCWKQGKVVYRYSDLHVTSPFPGWDYVGLVSGSSSSCCSSPWIRQRTGEFEHCFPSPWGSVCPEHVYPWIKQWMYAGGGYSVSGGY
ncbi:MAG TPA: hypothetical protein VFK41_04330 [Nocardioidaceae bacterium]|nr:hypothetical protein [Nocardioidaceae bacterium]